MTAVSWRVGRWVVAAVVAVVPLAAACSSDGGGSGEAAPAAGISPEVADALVGRWAHYDVVAYEDEVMRTLIISYGFNDFSVVDGELVDASTFCYSEQLTDQPIDISLSDEATQAIRPVPTPVTVTEVDGTVRLSRSPTPTPVGIRLDDPANDALPTDPADPRIVDDDGDGKPGITVGIVVAGGFSGELYIARREIFSYDVELTAPDRLDGVVTDESEQLVIDATDPAFLTSTAQWVQYPDLDRSPINLRRVDGDWDCERLRSSRDELFPPNPTIDW